jgi:hypothetical protein
MLRCRMRKTASLLHPLWRSRLLRYTGSVWIIANLNSNMMPMPAQ